MFLCINDEFESRFGNMTTLEFMPYEYSHVKDIANFQTEFAPVAMSDRLV